ncbi:hypothetical protein [Paenarthrobacter sp. YIM B13468]
MSESTWSPRRGLHVALRMLSVMGEFVEFERSRIRELQREDIAAAQQPGA